MIFIYFFVLVYDSGSEVIKRGNYSVIIIAQFIEVTHYYLNRLYEFIKIEGFNSAQLFLSTD